MKSVLLSALLSAYCVFQISPTLADDWRSKYSTGRNGELFEACCGIKDCRTSQSLGYPKMKRDKDGSYDVKIGEYWVRYDFPAVHQSEDSRTWVCYMETGAEPEPLCLFLPPGII